METLTKGTCFCKIVNADCLADCMKEEKYKENKVTKPQVLLAIMNASNLITHFIRKILLHELDVFLDGDKIEVPSP